MSILKRPTLERHIEEPCVRRAKKIGLVIRKMNGLGFRSWPDRLFIGLKRRVWVEFKAPGETPTDAQKLMHKILRACGEEVYVIDNKEEGLRLVNSIRPAPIPKAWNQIHVEPRVRRTAARSWPR